VLVFDGVGIGVLVFDGEFGGVGAGVPVLVGVIDGVGAGVPVGVIVGNVEQSVTVFTLPEESNVTTYLTPPSINSE
jgi:hypothetical protein